MACRFLKIPCVGYYDDYEVVPPRELVYAALDAFAIFNNCLEVALGDGKSDAGHRIELFGAAAFSRKGTLGP